MGMHDIHIFQFVELSYQGLQPRGIWIVEGRGGTYIARRANNYFTCRCIKPWTSGWTSSKTGLYLRWNKHYYKIVSNLQSPPPDILLIRIRSLINVLALAALVSLINFSVNICLFPISTEILKHYH